MIISLYCILALDADFFNLAISILFSLPILTLVQYLCSHGGWLLLKWSAIGQGFNGTETKCSTAHILVTVGDQLMICLLFQRPIVVSEQFQFTGLNWIRTQLIIFLCLLLAVPTCEQKSLTLSADVVDGITRFTDPYFRIHHWFSIELELQQFV